MTAVRPFGRRHLWRDERAAALVEFTILSPFLFTLAFGLFEFGRFLYQYQMVVEGLRDGTRYLARLDPEDETNKGNAANLATTGTIDGSGSERVDGWAAADVTFNVLSDVTGSYRGGGTVNTVEASTTFSYADLGLLEALGLGPISVSATHQQRAIEE